MQITVAICTWNRCESLRTTLENMTQLQIPSGIEWEIVIINNGSTDNTVVVVESFLHRLPIRLFSEPEPGLAHARNRAVLEASGAYILWTDDDVLVDHLWLAEYSKAFERWPKAVCFGGPVRPAFAVPPPDWLIQAWANVTDAYAVRDLGDQPIQLINKDLMPYGANFVVRNTEQRRHLYDTRFGHRREIKIGGEETRLLHTLLLSQGGEGWWVPGAIVQHIIPPERMTTRYIRQYYLGHGRYRERDRRVETGLSNSVDISTHRLWVLYLKAMRKEAYYRFSRVFCSPTRWVRHLIAASITWGRLMERRESP